MVTHVPVHTHVYRALHRMLVTGLNCGVLSVDTLKFILLSQRVTTTLGTRLEPLQEENGAYTSYQQSARRGKIYFHDYVIKNRHKWPWKGGVTKEKPVLALSVNRFVS